MSVDGAAISAIGVSLATAAGTVYTAWAGRRTRGQERRADFNAITGRLDKEVERLERRAEEQELEAAQQRARLASQEWTIRYLASWVRSLVATVRAAGQEPPPPPAPVPEEVIPYLHGIGV